MRDFVSSYTRCLFEFTAKRPAVDSDVPDLDRFCGYLSLDSPPRDLPDEPRFPAVDLESVGSSDGGRNTLLRLGRSVDHALVIRRYPNRTDLGLFAVDRDCTFRRALPGLRTPDGHSILASDALATNNDRTLLLLDDAKKCHVHELDMIRGAVVRSFRAMDVDGDDPMRVARLMPVSPADVSACAFLAYNPRDVMLFDPRLSSKIVQRSTYKTLCEFSAGTTTVSGKLAMGSATGVIRLYPEPCKSRATVNFQVNCGAEPITAVDVSPDEQWVLAACPYYLSVFNVLAASTGKSGFDALMGKEKPALTRLAIRPEHQQEVARYFDGAIPPFSSAKFEVKFGKVVAIVAAIGTALVSWDFRRIESQSFPTYCIKLIGGETIVDDEPLFTSSDLVIISDNQVSLVERFLRRRR
jgi:hypothetical protein